MTLPSAIALLAICGAQVALAVDVNTNAVADILSEPLTNVAGSAENGRVIVASRTVGLCLLCHPAAFAEQTQTGNLAPSLDGVGARYTTAQLRLRIVDNRRVNPDSIMPAYYRATNLNRVSGAAKNSTLLSAQQIEDVVAFLSTLK